MLAIGRAFKRLPLVGDQDSASGSQLLDRQLTNALEEGPIILTYRNHTQDDNTADVHKEMRLSTPKQEISVVVCTPFAQRPRSARTAAQKNDEDQASNFSMADYGSLDWDHSGDESEFERVLISARPRRASSAHSIRNAHFDTNPALPNKKRLRARSCPVDFESRVLQPRDARGRFARSSPATEKNGRTLKKPISSQRPSSSLSSAAGQQRDGRGRFARGPSMPSAATKALSKQKLGVQQRPPSRSNDSTQHQRDTRGRFARTPSKRPVAAASNIGSVVELSLREPALKAEPSTANRAKVKKRVAKSPYFPAPISPPKTPKIKSQSIKGSPSKYPAGGLVSCIPFPPLSASHFGLIQEKLAHNPFRLLIAVTFLIRTHGKHAIPVFYSLMSRFPTPQSLIEADKEDIVEIIRHLGLQNSRAATYQMYAKIWIEVPPVKGKRYAVKGYPEKDSGRDVDRDEVIDDEDSRVAWEIGHMTSGPYALDSWRIFCRDVLRGVATGWNGEGAKEGFQPEWMRVLPKDKELRAYLRWMWLKEGFEWDPFTGEKEVATEELMRAAMAGKIAWDDQGGMRILHEVANDATMAQGSSRGVESEVAGGQATTNEDLDSDLDNDTDDGDMDI